MKWTAVPLSLLITACGQTPPEDGFGVLKFGMSAKQLQPMGFSCGPDESSCDQIDPPPAAGQATLFDKPVRLSANLKNDRLSEIGVIVPNYDNDELITMYTEAYGSPTTCRFQNVLAATVERTIWSAPNGATITVSKILDYGIAPDLSRFAGISSSATYRSPAASKSFKASSC